MKNIWNFYTGKNNCDNIFEYIKNKNQTEYSDKANPVILLFDNEQKSERPLKKFLTYSDFKLDDGQISKQLEANLYLQTIPLVRGLDECEIEDLYKEQVLDATIHGKKFCRSSEYDSEKYFGKHKFSMHIMKHYKEIDFREFLPVLNSINKTVEL